MPDCVLQRDAILKRRSQECNMHQPATRTVETAMYVMQSPVGRGCYPKETENNNTDPAHTCEQRVITGSIHFVCGLFAAGSVLTEKPRAPDWKFSTLRYQTTRAAIKRLSPEDVVSPSSERTEIRPRDVVAYILKHVLNHARESAHKVVSKLVSCELLTTPQPQQRSQRCRSLSG